MKHRLIVWLLSRLDITYIHRELRLRGWVSVPWEHFDRQWPNHTGWWPHLVENDDEHP